jgi:hypothetical protein
VNDRKKRRPIADVAPFPESPQHAIISYLSTQ